MDSIADTPIRVGAWYVDPILCQISKGKEYVRVEARAMRLLMFLALRPGQVLSVDDLLSQVWAGVIVTPDSVYQAVTSLRRILGDDPKHPQYIATVPRLGYRMIATVTPWNDFPAPHVRVPENALDTAEEVRTKRFSASRWNKLAISMFAVSAVGLLLAAAYLAHTRTVSEARHSVAVLPFLDLTTQEMNEEFFADGLTEELIGDLSKIPSFQVPSATAAFYFKGKQLPIADIARQLGVTYVLDGSVRKSGDVYRVATRLVQADNGYVFWSETFDRSLGDLVKVQRDVAAEATKAVRASIEGTQKAQSTMPSRAH